MGKIKNFLSKWFDEDFWNAVISIIGVAAISLGLQYLMFWGGSSVQSVAHLEYYIDTGFFVLLLIVASPGLDPAVIFPFKGTRIPGTICVSAMCFGMLGVYVYIVYANMLALALISLMLIVVGWAGLEKIDADMHPPVLYTSVGLIYALGAHYAMQLNGIAVLADSAIIIIVFIVALLSWFRPVID